MISRALALATFELVVVFCGFVALDVLRIRQALPHPDFGDEWRYLYYADNLLHGFFSPRDRVFIWNGPGYPLLIAPFVGAGWNDGARYANAFWHAGTMAYAWAILRPYLRVRWVTPIVGVLGCYGPLVSHLPLVYTEVVCGFLLTGWLYHTLRSEHSVVNTVIAGVYLGALVLVKVVFGVSVMVFSAVLFGLWLLRRSRARRAYLMSSLLALALCVPYLAYTHKLTGRWLYWSSGMGSAFYWLTAPAREESGDWYHQGWVRSDPLLRAHHGEIFARTTGTRDNPSLSEREQVFNLSTPESADIFLAAGVDNVRRRPLKFVRNYVANLSRLFFDVPTSVRGTPFWNESTLWHLPLLLWTFGCLGHAAFRGVALPRGFWPGLMLMLLTLGAYTFNSIVARYLVPFVPLWWVTSWAWASPALERRAGRTQAGHPPG